MFNCAVNSVFHLGNSSEEFHDFSEFALESSRFYDIKITKH